MRLQPPREGFTLIELLATVAIIALLAAIAFPAIGNMRDRALEVDCTANLRQLGSALLQHAADHNGEFPTTQASYWGNQPTLLAALEPYLGGDRKVWYCKRYLQDTGYDANDLYEGGSIGYYYWAWTGDWSASGAMRLATSREDSPWIIQGWNNDLPGNVLLSDIFGAQAAWGGPGDVQFHAAGSRYLSLTKPGSNILVSSGAVLKAPPLK